MDIEMSWQPSKPKPYPERNDIRVGDLVVTEVTGFCNGAFRGRVSRILTNAPTHPYGIKVRLESGFVGRVTDVLSKVPR